MHHLFIIVNGCTRACVCACVCNVYCCSTVCCSCYRFGCSGSSEPVSRQHITEKRVQFENIAPFVFALFSSRSFFLVHFHRTHRQWKREMENGMKREREWIENWQRMPPMNMTSKCVSVTRMQMPRVVENVLRLCVRPPPLHLFMFFSFCF